MTAEELAQAFHESYERRAPSFGYSTREESAKPWSEVPENNRRLMVAVCDEMLNRMPVLAGLMALKVDGPTTVILRPRRRLAVEEMIAVRDSLHQIATENVRFVLVASEFDIMAVGDAELEHVGVTQLPR